MTSLVSELSHRLMLCLNTSPRLLLCTFLCLGLQELNDLNSGASSRLSSALLWVSVSVSACKILTNEI